MRSFPIKVQVDIFLPNESFPSGSLSSQRWFDIDPVHRRLLQMTLEDFVHDFVPRILRTFHIVLFELIVANASHNANVCSQLPMEAGTFQTNEARQDLASESELLLWFDEGYPRRTLLGTIRTCLVTRDSQNSGETLLQLYLVFL